MADTRMAIAARPLDGRGQRERIDRTEDFFERDADLQAGQVRPETEVRAVPSWMIVPP
jgi:hypothetical protein